MSEPESTTFRATIGDLGHEGATPQEALASLLALLPGEPAEPIVIWPPAAADYHVREGTRLEIRELWPQRNSLPPKERRSLSITELVSFDTAVGRTRLLAPAMLDDLSRHAFLQLLGRSMCALSEECHGSGWLPGTEHLIPELCRRATWSREDQPWRQGRVTVDTARALTMLAVQIGSWAKPDPDGNDYVAHQPFPLSFEQARDWFIYDLFEAPGSEVDLEYVLGSGLDDPTSQFEAVAYVLTHLPELPITDPERAARAFQVMFNEIDELGYLFRDEEIPVARRAEVIGQIDRLYTDFFAKHCAARLDSDEDRKSEVAQLCFMLWDISPVVPCFTEVEVIDAAIAAFQRVLEMDNESCVQSALHGLGHWVDSRRDLTPLILGSIRDSWSESLIGYAQVAAYGNIL